MCRDSISGPIQPKALYHKLGWQVVERTNYFGKGAVVMQIDLRGQ
jgi:hypothetical protein